MRCLLLTVAFGVLAWGQGNVPIAVVLANGTKCPMTIVREEPGARIVEPRGQRRGCPRTASRITHTSSRWGRTRSVLRHITRPVLGVAVGVPATAVTATIGLIEGDPVLGLAVGVMIAYALAESGYANALYVDRDVLEPVAAGTVQP